MAKFIVILALIAFSFIESKSQILNGQDGNVLVKGYVTDELSGEPMGISIEIRDQSDKRIKLQSNSKYGFYSQLLTSGQSYTVILSNFNIIRKILTINIKRGEKYFEEKIDFTVKKLRVGFSAYEIKAFDSAQTVLLEEARQKLSDIEEFMRFNRSVKFELLVNSHDTYSMPPIIAKEQPIPVKKGGKKDKKDKVNKTTQVLPVTVRQTPTQDQINALVDQRMSQLNSYLVSWKGDKKRISVKADYTIAESPLPGESIAQKPNLIVMVKELEDVFNR